MKVLKITKEEKNQIEEHLIKLESKVDKAKTVLWYLEDEKLNLRSQNMLNIIKDNMNSIKRDIDKFYVMVGFKSSYKKCSPTRQSKKLH